MRREPRAPASGVTLCATELALAKVRLRRAIGVFLVRATVVGVGAIVSLVVVIASVIRNVGRDRSTLSWRHGKEVSLMVQEFFVDFSDSWRRLTTFKLITHRLVCFRESAEYIVKLIFMIDHLTKQSKLIYSSSNTLKIFIDSFGTFLPSF